MLSWGRALQEPSLGRLRLYDYRCFRREEPATLVLAKGFTSFIGPNNAGKSTLLRTAFELRSAIQVLLQMPTLFGNVGNNFIGWNFPPPVHEHAEIIADRNDPACAIELEPCIPPGADSVFRARMEFAPNGSSFLCRLFDADSVELGIQNSATTIAGHDGNRLILASGRSIDMEPFLRLVDSVARTQYFGPFRNAINEGGGGHFDTQIGTGFISQWHQWKTGASKTQNRAIGRVTEDIRRLLGAKTLEINASNELKTLQVVVNGRPHRLQELGAGFSQLVIVLGNALIRQPSFVLIDEPELHLHPALQNEFLTTLATYAEHGILYTTHSMGLARLADFCYTVQRRNERSSVRPFDRTPNYAEFLGSLGIAGLSDLGWDRILLVEGTKDVRTLQQMLRHFDKDRKTIVLPLGGESLINGNVTHELAEVRRLCDRVAAIVDSERESEGTPPLKARMDFAEVCRNLGIECCVTERRAIENYLSQGALDSFWGTSRFSALGPFDEPPRDGSFWGKGESWKAAGRMSAEELSATDIGRFLAAL